MDRAEIHRAKLARDLERLIHDFDEAIARAGATFGMWLTPADGQLVVAALRQLAAPEGDGDPVTAANCSERIAGILMDAADLLAVFPDAEPDERAWQHLLIYAPRAPEGGPVAWPPKLETTAEQRKFLFDTVAASLADNDSVPRWNAESMARFCRDFQKLLDGVGA